MDGRIKLLITTSYSLLRVTTLSAFLSGCALMDQHGLGLLEGHGPQRVSTSNPFIAANQALAQEAEKSPELSGFLEKAGQPQALEVSRDGVWSPLKVRLEYGQETYIAEKSTSGWLIQGPLEENVRPVSSSASTKEAPKEVAQVSTTETPLATPVVLKGEPVVIERNPQPHRSDIALKPKNVSPLAEISPRGDLVHYVVKPHEDLKGIAAWYTGAEENAGRIARINQFSQAKPLEPGDTIVIPSYLVTRRDRLSQN